MCERAIMHLAADRTAPGEARRFVADHCRRWGVSDLADSAALLTSELVTNAVLHAGTPITVTASLTQHTIEVGVADRDARAPVRRPARADLLTDLDAVITHADPFADDRHTAWHVGPAGPVTAGRGLLVLDTIADQWGVARRSAGKEVWFVLAAADSTPRRSCPCDDASPFPIGSGRRVATTAGDPGGETIR